MRTPRSERVVELYVGVASFGSEGGYWYLQKVSVDSSLDMKEAGEAAIDAWHDARVSEREMAAVFVGVYCVWNDELMEMHWNPI